MKKWTKIFFAALAVLVALAVALIVLANILVTPERVKRTLLPLVEENMNRKVELGDIQVSLFSGIEIHGLTIYEQGGSEVFVSTDLMRLKYQLLPLLAMKVVVDEVLLEKPEIRVVRLKDGRFNFSDLLGTPETTASDKQTSSSNQSGTSISLLVSNVSLKDGQLTFLDHSMNDASPYRYQLSALQVAAKGVSLTGKVPLSVHCQVNGSPLALDGHISLSPLGGDFKVELLSLDIVAFSPYLKDVLPGKLGGLKLTVKSALSGTPDDVALSGSLSFADLDLVLDALPDTAIKKAGLEVNYDFQYKQKQALLSLDKLELDYNGIKVNVKGDISDLSGVPKLALAVVVPSLQLREALDAVPDGLIGDVGSLDPAGTVSIESALSGAVDEGLGLLKTASVSLDSVQATAGGYRPALTGQLTITGDQVTSEGLFARLGDNRAEIILTADHLFDDTVVVNADITSKRFELKPLLGGNAGAVIATDQAEDVGDDRSTSEEIGPFDIPLHATGTLKITEALWKNLSISNFLVRYELKDNVLHLTRMDGQVAGGSFSNSARVDLGKKGLAYSADLDVQTVQAGPLLAAFAPKVADSLSGAMNLDLDVKGRGTQWETLSKKLSGQGNVLLADGRVVSPGLVKGFASFLQLSDTDEISFSTFQGDVKIADGKLQLDSSLLSEQFKLFPKGTIGLDGAMDLSMDTRLSPQLSDRLDKKGNVTKYLTDEEGWSQLPLLISGNYASPAFSLDPKGMKSQAQEALSKELGRQINKLFKQPEPASQESSQQLDEGSPPAEDPTRKLLQDSLQKLFGN
jgi:AsmA protein